MKILREGNWNWYKNPKKFKCDRCGCILEAVEGEYEKHFDTRNDMLFSTFCPTCGKKIFWYREGENA